MLCLWSLLTSLAGNVLAGNVLTGNVLVGNVLTGNVLTAVAILHWRRSKMTNEID
jgi:hypothetical protein